jgi:phospholipid-translocating ATPase
MDDPNTEAQTKQRARQFLAENFKSTQLDISNTLLRGSVLRNTGWVIAVAVFTGAETKIMLNAGVTPSKRSRIEKLMNRQVNN